MAYYIPLPGGQYAEVPDNIPLEDARKSIFDANPEFFPEEVQRDYRQADTREDTWSINRGARSGWESFTGNIGAAWDYYLAGGTFDEYLADPKTTREAAHAATVFPSMHCRKFALAPAAGPALP